MTKIYQKALTEVYEILRYLEEDSYRKIPKDIIKAIEENRDLEYNYFIDESLSFFEQEMLPETKAILFHFYRDYLTTPAKRKKIMDYQNRELQLWEETKRQRYNPNHIFYKK